MEKEFDLQEAYYGCDGGCLHLISSKGTSIKFPNNVGDGEYKLYVLRVAGWGPTHYKDAENYKKYKNFLKCWEEIPAAVRADITKGDLWKVMYYDGDKNYDDPGIELDGRLIQVYRKRASIKEDCVSGDMLVVPYAPEAVNETL